MLDIEPCSLRFKHKNTELLLPHLAVASNKWPGWIFWLVDKVSSSVDLMLGFFCKICFSISKLNERSYYLNWSILYNWDCNWYSACGWPDCFHVVGICYFAEFWTVIFQNLSLIVDFWNILCQMYARTEIATEITTCGDMQELKLCLMYARLSYIPILSTINHFHQELGNVCMNWNLEVELPVPYKPIHAM